MDTFVESLSTLIVGMPAAWHPFILAGVAYVGWAIAKKKGWVNGTGGQYTQMLEDIKAEVSNHLSTAIKDHDSSTQGLAAEITTAIRDNSSAVRDLAEELHRNVNTMNVVLSKQDKLTEHILEIKGKVGG